MLARLRQRGDTLIEVLFAVAVFSAVAIGTIVIMNQGISSAQNALEISLVRNQIDTQAELLRHLNNGKLTSIGRNSNDAAQEWDKAVNDSRFPVATEPTDYTAITSFSQCTPAAGGAIPANAFFLNPKTGKVVRRDDVAGGAFLSASTFAQVQHNPAMPATDPSVVSNMIWIEPVSYDNDTETKNKLSLTKYYDFHIRACWDSPGSGGGVMKLGTIVRLYVPKQ